PYAFAQIQKKALEKAKAGGAAAVEATRKALELKETLLSRPLEKLVEEPHFLSAWLSEQRLSFTCEGDRVVWKKNPLRVLAETYNRLHMNDQPGAPAAHLIWPMDRELLETGLAFYEKLRARAPEDMDFPTLDATLRSPKAS